MEPAQANGSYSPVLGFTCKTQGTVIILTFIEHDQSNSYCGGFTKKRFHLG